MNLNNIKMSTEKNKNVLERAEVAITMIFGENDSRAEMQSHGAISRRNALRPSCGNYTGIRCGLITGGGPVIISAVIIRRRGLVPGGK